MRFLGELDAAWDSDHCWPGNNGSNDKVVVLAFGRPINLLGPGGREPGEPYYGYGTILPRTENVTARYDTIVWLVEQYAEAYFWRSTGCPRLHIAIGTSNSFLCERSPRACDPYWAGRAWGDVVQQVQLWLNDRGYGGEIRADGAADIETHGYDPTHEGEGWHCFGPPEYEEPMPPPHDSRRLVDGFADNNPAGARLLNFGDAATSEGCWSIQDVFYVSWSGNSAFWPLPQTYYTASGPCAWTTGTSGTTPCIRDFDGADVSRGFGLESSNGRVYFVGQMTGCPEGDPIPPDYCNNRTEFNPGQAWNKLWQAQWDYYRQASMPYSTNIQNQR